MIQPKIVSYQEYKILETLVKEGFKVTYGVPEARAIARYLELRKNPPTIPPLIYSVDKLFKN